MANDSSLTSTTNQTIPPNNYSYFPGQWSNNWTYSGDCLVIPYTMLHLLPGNNPDGSVSADQRHTVHQFKNCLLAFLFLIGAPTNFINMAVFFKQGLKDRVTFCLFFLALIDEVYVTVAMVFQAEELYVQFATDDPMGHLYASIINKKALFLLGTYYVSPILSAIISVDRCLCVFNPLKSQMLIRTRSIAVIIVLVNIVICALAYVVFLRFRATCIFDPLLGTQVRAPMEHEFYRDHKDLINFIEGIFFGVIILGGTMFIVAITTILTAMKLRQIRLWRSESSSSLSSRDITLTKMLVGSSIVFIVSVSPYAWFNIVRQFFPEVDYGQSEHNLYASCALLFNALVLIKPSSNILVYYTMGSRYREVFWNIFGRKRTLQDPKPP